MTNHPVILFDGVCNLCHAAVQWVIDHDPKQIFRFASLQSQAARHAIGDAGPLPDSVVLVDDSGIHTRSAAAIGIAKRLGFPWSLAIIASVFPSFLRDGFYNWIARNRYRWFGKQTSCRIPTPELASRFLDADETIPIPEATPTAASGKSFSKPTA